MASFIIILTCYFSFVYSFRKLFIQDSALIAEPSTLFFNQFLIYPFSYPILSSFVLVSSCSCSSSIFVSISVDSFHYFFRRQLPFNFYLFYLSYYILSLFPLVSIFPVFTSCLPFRLFFNFLSCIFLVFKYLFHFRFFFAFDLHHSRSPSFVYLFSIKLLR